MNEKTQSSCQICGAIHQLEVHHIISRGMGGSSRPEIEAPENKILICRSCHTEITEHRWSLTRTTAELKVISVPTGDLVIRRLFDPTFNVPLLFATTNAVEVGLEAVLTGIPYLTDEQLIELFQQVRGIDKGAWKVQAGILWEAKQRSVYGDKAWEAVGRSFGIGWRQAYNLARVWETFFKGTDTEFCNQMQNCSLEEVTWYIVATETQAPHFWLQYAEDQKNTVPSYSIADFKEEIGLANARQESETACGTSSQKCRWLRVYCEKLDQVVRPGQCPGCDIFPSIQEALR